VLRPAVLPDRPVAVRVSADPTLLPSTALPDRLGEREVHWPDGVHTLAELGAWLGALPYGRNSDRSDPLCILAEGHGTCSTKHGLLALAASASEPAPLQLVVALITMDASSHPAIAPTLAQHGLSAVLEAHSYVRVGEHRLDLTGAGTGCFDLWVEAPASPEALGTHKVAWHRDALARWLHRPHTPDVSLERAWDVREACIAALGEP